MVASRRSFRKHSSPSSSTKTGISHPGMLKTFRNVILLLTLGFHYCAHAVELPAYRQNPIASNLTAPTALAIDVNGTIYVSESSNHRLHVYSSNRDYLKTFSKLSKPYGIAVDSSGRIYICNGGRGNVEVYDSRFTLLYKLGAGNGEFNLPVAVALGSSGNIYVVDAKGNMVKVYRPDGTFAFSFGGSGNSDGKFNFPTSISIQEATGEVIVSDLPITQTGIQGARIQVFDGNGIFKRKFGSFGQGKGLLIKPLGTAVDTEGRIYVTDAYQDIIHLFDGNGNYITTIGDLNHPLRTPLGIAISRKTGKLYVASLNTSTVEIYGDKTVDAGGGGDTGGSGDPGGTGGSGGTASLTFLGSGARGCSVAVNSPDSPASSPGCLIPLVLLSIYLFVRKGKG